jgi:YVTN family beta-propeller protein
MKRDGDASGVGALETGTTVAGYRIEAVLGHGSMGTVYSAADVALERRVALKVLTPELARDVRFRDRFLRESKLAASLEHPHIVPIHSAGEDNGVLYLAMRYVDGRDLGALLESLGRLDAERTLAILEQVGDALDAAHARELVHRDVKPANILLAKGDYAYLCDFGLAKHASTVSSLTGSRAILGTVDYLAPEQIEARPVDGRVDVYALGCVLYECLTGEPPHRRDNELAALLAHVNDPAPKPSERRSELPVALDDVIATSLAKDREARFATCSELVEAARVALHGDVPELPAAPQPVAPAVRTFLFADVRGYTAYTREHGDEAGAALAKQFAGIVEELAPAHHGTMQELRGDEALVVFDSARAALRFGVELQAKVVEDALPRPVGVGLDTGEAVPVEDGFRGGALNRAARLCALARPAEVLASDAVRELAGATEGVAFGYRRFERLKGFEKPVGVIEIHPTERAPRRQLGRRTKRALLGTRPRLRLAIAAVVVAAGAAAGALLVTTGGAGKPVAGTFKADTVGLLDAKTLKPAGSLDQLGSPLAMWRDPAGEIWALDHFASSLIRIDPRTRQTTANVRLGLDPGGVAFGTGSVWVGDYDSPAVDRYDSEYGTLTKRIPLPSKDLPFAGLTTGVAFGGGSLWVGYGKYPFRVARIDPRTNRVIKTFDFPNSDGPALLAYGAGSIWIASQDKGGIWRIDPRTNQVAMHTKLHGGWVQDLAVVDGYAWLPVQGDGAVWQVDRNGNVLRSFPTGNLPVALGAANGRLYVANERSETVSRVDPATGKVTTVAVGHSPESAIVAGGRVWVSLAQTVADVTKGLSAGSIARGITVDDPYYTTDPALYSEGNVQLQQAVGARLLRYPDEAQPRGATLVPEIADLPTVSDGGRTYTFRIRPGYRFSRPSNAPVTADVMRYSIERALSPKITEPTNFGRALVADIEGFAAYRDGKAPHISGIHVDGDKLSFRLVKPDPDFPARISLTFFTAVPLGTPVRAHGVEQPIPSAGPYYIAEGSTLVLKRNPNYHGPRRHRLDAIVFTPFGGTSGLEQVVRDRSDYAWTSSDTPPSLVPGGPLDHRFGARSPAAEAGTQRYFVTGISGVRMIAFNTESGIFRDRRLRRAVNYALDRPALASATDDTPYDDLLPPGIPGSRGGQALYPLKGPDLPRARALAGSARRRAVLLIGTPESCEECASLASTIRGDLARIGIDVEVKASQDPFGEVSKPGARWDLFPTNWFADYPDPSDFVNELLDAGQPLAGVDWGGPGTFIRYRDQQYLRRMRSAFLVQGSARAGVYRRLEMDMFRSSPPMAVYATVRGTPQLFSSRIGCQVFRPQDAGLVDLAALCIRGKS